MTRFERWSLWVTTFLTVATGVGYFWTKYMMTPPDPYAVVNHPLQPLFLKAHIVVSPLLLFALGLIAVRHVWAHFRSGVRWSRKSGLTTALSVVPMVLTGYLIQVLTDAGWVQAMAIAHIGFGALFAAGMGLHSWIIRKMPAPEAHRRRKRREAASAEERAGPAPGDVPAPGGEAPAPGATPSGASRAAGGHDPVGRGAG